MQTTIIKKVAKRFFSQLWSPKMVINKIKLEKKSISEL